MNPKGYHGLFMRSDDKDAFRIRAIAILFAVLFHVVSFGLLGWLLQEDPMRSVLILELDWKENRKVSIEAITTEKNDVAMQTSRKRNVSSFKEKVMNGSVTQHVSPQDSSNVLHTDADMGKSPVLTMANSDRLISMVESNPAVIRFWFEYQLYNPPVLQDSLATVRRSLDHIQISLSDISSVELELRRNQQWYGQKDNPFRPFALNWQVNLIPILRIVLNAFN